MKKSAPLVFTLLILFSAGTFAYEGDLYSGIMWSNVTMKYEPSDYPEDGFEIEPSALIARFGGYLTENIALEMRFGTSAKPHTERGEGEYGDPIDIDISVNTIYGLYAVFSTVDDDPGYYAFVGYTSAELIVDDEEGYGSVDQDDDTSFGLGVRYGALTLEYVQYIDEKEYDVSGLNVGLTATF